MLTKQIICFLEVASCLSFSAAADHLFMSQQAVTSQVANLERQLGVSLFTRTTRSVELTEAGRIARDEFTRIKHQIDESLKKVRYSKTAAKPAITLGFFSYLSKSKIILPLLDMLSEKHPNVTFEMKLNEFIDMRNKLFDGELDICVTTSGDWQRWPSVVVYVLREMPYEIVCSIRHPLALKDTVTSQDLKEHTLIALPPSVILGGDPEGLSLLPHKQIITVTDLNTLLLYVQSGNGFSYLTRAFEGSDSGDFRFFPSPFGNQHADIICAYREDTLNPLIPVVAKSIRNYLKQYPW
jgi:DNA-binding transcriptional LysR family regulator